MNWDQVKGNWKEFKGKVRSQWGDLTDDDVEKMAGERDQLVGRIQQRYGCTREEADRQVRDWEGTMH
ncbi:MAG TPA: CsbD family protein [Candidatus Omnitrophota bacterium]|nr:CsbD family protein [Candidatus Omnitrophota bacterium]